MTQLHASDSESLQMPILDVDTLFCNYIRIEGYRSGNVTKFEKINMEGPTSEKYLV